VTPPQDNYDVPYPGAARNPYGRSGGYAPAHAAPSPGNAPAYGAQAGYGGPNWTDPRGDAAFRTPPQQGGGHTGSWDAQPQEAGREGHDEEPLIRPYAMTGGRTKPRYQLAIEALVSTSAHPDRIAGLLPEHQRICDLCMEIKSVAEVSALLSMPLGVARILVADLAESGLVAIHQPAAAGGDAGGQPDVTLLERVLSGLRKL